MAYSLILKPAADKSHVQNHSIEVSEQSDIIGQLFICSFVMDNTVYQLCLVRGLDDVDIGKDLVFTIGRRVRFNYTDTQNFSRRASLTAEPRKVDTMHSLRMCGKGEVLTATREDGGNLRSRMQLFINGGVAILKQPTQYPDRGGQSSRQGSDTKPSADATNNMAAYVLRQDGTSKTGLSTKIGAAKEYVDMTSDPQTWSLQRDGHLSIIACYSLDTGDAADGNLPKETPLGPDV